MNASTPSTATDERGFLLVGVIMFMLALTILGLSLFALSSYEAQFFNDSAAREQSLQSSESGMEVVKQLLSAPPYRLESAQLAVGQFGITRALAYQRRTTDTSSVGLVNWDSTLVIVVSARSGGEERTVQARFQPTATRNPYQRLVTCGLGFLANGGTNTVQMQGKVWQHVQYPADSLWTTKVNWTSGRPIDITTPPIPLADAFVDARLPGAGDLTNTVTTGSSGGSGTTSYALKLSNASATTRYYTLSTPHQVTEQSNDPELSWYGCFFDQRLTLSVKGTCVLVIPDGACFRHEVTIKADGNGATGTLVVVAKANSRQPGNENRALWFEGGFIHTDPNIRVFLVSEGDIAITHDHNSTNVSHESKALSIVCGGLELMGPDPGSVFKLAYASAMDAIAENLLSAGALPALSGGSSAAFALSSGSWLETTPR
jgi:hypothetical protein